MFDKIEKKVHEVQQQPEHIRLRWVWGSVAITMLFVVIIWAMSMRVNFLNINSDTKAQQSINEFQDQFSNITDTLPSEEPVSIDELLENSGIEQ